jgi:hypothetical protein
MANIIRFSNEMIGWNMFYELFLKREPNHPGFDDVDEVEAETLYWSSLTRGVGISGNPGTGKTTSCARIAMDYALENRTRPLIIYDASGSLTDEFLKIMMALPSDNRDAIWSRVILDIPGHPNFVVPKPLFHEDYGLPEEELVQKAVSILKELNREKMENTPIMATAINTTAPELFRLISKITDREGAGWQVTEAKKLLVGNQDDPENQLKLALKYFGEFAPSAKWYLEKEVDVKLAPANRESRVGVLVTALGVIETKPLRARYGHYRPGVTYREIIDKGLIYIVSGEKLTNQEDAQAWVFWDEFAGLRAVINQRMPHDEDEKPVLLIIDEVYKLFEIKGMAKALGQISTYFRNRKLMPMIVIQAFWQLDKLLQQQYWNLGNLVSFQMDNFNDAYNFAQQLFQYQSKATKFDAPREGINPTAETDRGQYLQEANWIQNLGWRSVVMRRYVNERDKEGFIAYVNKTQEVARAELNKWQMVEIKERLLKRRALPVIDVLKIVNQRELSSRTKLGSERPGPKSPSA